MVGKCVSSTFVLTQVFYYVQYSPKTEYTHVQYFHRIFSNILLVEKKNGMDESGNVNTVRILPPLTTSRIRSQLISCQPIGDWQTKG